MARALPRIARTTALLLALLSVVAPSRADENANEADLQFQLGAELYAKGDYRGALTHFLASHRLVPNVNVAYNIARAYEQLRRFPQAYFYYTQVLDGEKDEAQRTSVQESLSRVSANVAVLSVETDPPGAAIYLDRKNLGVRGVSPRKLGVVPGTYRLLLELPGHEPMWLDVTDARAGVETKLTVKLAPILGTIRVVADPPGSEVRVDSADGPSAGTSPLELQLTPGRHTLYVGHAGYSRGEMPVDVAARESTTVTPRLSVQTGNLVVKSDVRDAAIEIDGRTAGFAPAVLPLPVGPHRVRLLSSGYRPLERAVTVTAGEQSELDVSLTQLDEINAASRTAESAEDAPSSVSIISSRELRGMMYPTIAEALRGVRGAYITDDRSYTFVGFRGISRTNDYGNKVLILQDGMPLNDDILGQSYAGFEGRTDLADVERIEVVRGPGSALYGTGAFLGVINLVTRHRDSPTFGEAEVSTADYGVTRARATASGQLGAGGSIWTSVALGKGTGRDLHFSEYAGDPRTGGTARGVDGFESGTFQGRYTRRAFTVQWFFTTRKKTIPTGEYDTVFGDPRQTFQDTRGLVEARFEPQLGDTLQLLSRAHANLYDFQGASPYAPGDGGVALEQYRGRWVGFEQRAIVTPRDGVRLTVGAEVQKHVKVTMEGHDDGGSYLDVSQPFWVAAAYGVADVRLSRAIKVSAGARYDHFSTVGGSANPRGALIMTPYENGTIKLMGGTAFRAPSAYELYYQAATQRASPGLSPEHVASFEVEMSHHFSSSVVGTAAGYVNYITGLVVGRGAGTPEDKTFLENSSSPARTVGAEAEVRRDFRDGWMVSANYALQRTVYLGGGLREVPNSPTHLASMKAGFPILGRALSGMTRISLESSRYDRHDAATDPPQTHTGGAVVWDLVFTGESERYNVGYGLGAYNLGDSRYTAPVSTEFRQRAIVQNGRTLLAHLSIRL